MNENFAFDLARLKHCDDVSRAETNLKRLAATRMTVRGNRDRLAMVLVALANRLQPALTIEIRRPSEPAVA